MKKQLLRNNEYYDIQTDFDALYEKSKNYHSFNNLMELIIDPRNIILAYRNIKGNGGSNTPGTDRKTIRDYEILNKKELINLVRNQLNNYNPKTVRRVEIPKDNGKTRPLGIPCMEDRLIQQCIKQVLEPICEAKFHNHSYGFRPNRSTHHAISRAQTLINRNKLHYVIDIDIKGFFDNINHSKLLKQMWTLGIKDKTLLTIIKKILSSEVQGLGKQEKGTPQGGIISPLLSNIVLNELDWWVSSQWETYKTHRAYVCGKNKNGTINRGDIYKVLKESRLKEMFLVRYADDFKIFCRTYEDARKTFTAIKEWLKERLGLEINEEKSKITNVRKNKTKFLGLRLWAVKKGKEVVKGKEKDKYVCNSRMTNKATKNVINKLINQIKVIQKDRTAKQVNKYNSMVLGIHNYYRIATHVNLDMSEIAFRVNRTFDNRLKLEKKEILYQSETYKRLYGEYTNNRGILGIKVFPLHGCKTKASMNFTQTICNYTEEGRELIHKTKNYNHLISIE